MYIEKDTLLVKKVRGKKISVSLLGISDEQACEKITHKELDIWKQQESYQLFARELYDTNILEKVVYKSCFIQNMVFFDNSLSEKYNIGLRDFPQRFIYESNKTEGSRIPFEQLQLLFQNKKSSHTNTQEIQEVKNSITLWEYLQEGFVFNTANIKKVYHKLTKNLYISGDEKYPRGFRKTSVIVNNFETIPPSEIDSEIHRLLEQYREHKKELFPLQLAFDFHLRFEQIHPFIDGNGRIGRMIMNKIFLTNHFIPCIVFSENRQGYFNAIASARGGRKKKYYTFMLEQYDKTLNTLL